MATNFDRTHRGNTTGNWGTNGNPKDTTPVAGEKKEMRKTVRDSDPVPNAQRPQSKLAE